VTIENKRMWAKMTSCDVELFTDPVAIAYQNLICADYALLYAREYEPNKVMAMWAEYKECLEAYHTAVKSAVA
jgi:hypothetical protein